MENKAKKTSLGSLALPPPTNEDSLNTSRPSKSLNKMPALEEFLNMEDSPGMSSRIERVLQTEASGTSRTAWTRVGSPWGSSLEASLRSYR